MLPFLRSFAILVAAGVLSGCVSIFNDPVNMLAHSEPTLRTALPELPGGDDTTFVGLGFSGGGTRAAAFAYGMLLELEATQVPKQRGKSMIQLTRFISGVSGGSVMAAYYGLKGRQGYRDFREKFLIQDGESRMKTNVGVGTFVRALQGGVNNDKTFSAWLNENVFEGARFADMWKPDRPIIWINATDIFNRAPFIFNAQTFAALCSDLAHLPIADAVGASAAVPVVFAPVVLEAFGNNCPYQFPAWLRSALTNPSAPKSLKAYVRALESYRDPEKLKFVKLVDGGVTDNFGITGVTLARAQSQTPYGPLSIEQAIKAERLIYLVADASQEPAVGWTGTSKGPTLVDMVMALTDTAINNSVREGYDAFRGTMREWHDDLIEFRCGLSEEEVLKHRKTLEGWNCRDLKFFISDINAEDLTSSTNADFQKVPTRLVLPLDQVDTSIQAGREALRNDPIWKGAIRSMQGIETDGLERMSPHLAPEVHMAPPGTHTDEAPESRQAANPAASAAN